MRYQGKSDALAVAVSLSLNGAGLSNYNLILSACFLKETWRGIDVTHCFTVRYIESLKKRVVRKMKV